MAALTIKMESADDALVEDPQGGTASMVRIVAEAIEEGRQSGRLLDINGNSVGFWTFNPDADE